MIVDIDKGDKVPICIGSANGIHTLFNFKNKGNIRIDRCSVCGLEIRQLRDLDYEEKQKTKKSIQKKGDNSLWEKEKL